MADHFTRAFGNAFADVRRELIENAWFGRPEPRQPGGNDRVPDEKLSPDKNAERGFLGWLQAEPERDRSSELDRADPGHEIDR